MNYVYSKSQKKQKKLWSSSWSDNMCYIHIKYVWLYQHKRPNTWNKEQEISRFLGFSIVFRRKFNMENPLVDILWPHLKRKRKKVTKKERIWVKYNLQASVDPILFYFIWTWTINTLKLFNFLIQYTYYEYFI